MRASVSVEIVLVNRLSPSGVDSRRRAAPALRDRPAAFPRRARDA